VESAFVMWKMRNNASRCKHTSNITRADGKYSIIVLLVVGIAIISSSSATASWNNEGFDSARTNAAPGEFPERYEINWSYDGNTSNKNYLVSASGKVFYSVDSPSGYQKIFRAISGENGAEVWNLTASTDVFYENLLSPAAAQELVILHGLAYVVVNESLQTELYLRALDIENGDERWNFSLDHLLENGIVAERDRLYAVDWTGTIQVLNLTTGELIFENHLGSSNVWTWAVEDGIVYYYAEYSDSDEDGIGAFDTVANATLWNYPLAEKEETIMVADGKVFFGAAGFFHVFDAATGEPVNVFSAGGLGLFGSSSFRVNHMAYSDGMFVASISDEPHIVAKRVDGEGSGAWHTDYDGAIAVGDGKVFVQETNFTTTRLRVLDLYTGEELDVITIDEPSSRRTPILSDGRVYFTTDSHLWALQKLRQPDLAVGSLALSPGEGLRDGDSATLEFSVANLGDRAADNATVALYDDGVLLWNESLASLPLDWQRDFALPWTATTGWHNLTVTVTVEPDDYNLSDNDATLSVYARPLRVDGALLGAEHAPAVPLVNETLTLAVTVGNSGETTLEGLTLTLTADGAAAGSAAVPLLAPGATATVALEWTAGSAGSHALLLVLEGAQGDIAPGNDTLALTVEVAAPEEPPPLPKSLLPPWGWLGGAALLLALLAAVWRWRAA